MAVGSPALDPAAEHPEQADVLLRVRLRYQKLGELTSFQSCQSMIGSFGMVGFSDQKVPLAPYRSAAAWTKARKSPRCRFDGG